MEEIFAAFLAAITGSPGAEPLPVFDWSDEEMADDAKPTRYIAVSDFTPTRNTLRLSGHRGVSGHLFAVTIVGETTTEVRAASDRIRNRLEDLQLVAGTGEAITTPLHQDETNQQPVVPMEDTSNPRLFTTLEMWRCATTRIPAA